ncbi:Ctr copper transporter [Curvularia clavata]|uniref:Copper transport protein n=1 Tax=Curvularia clavata TaxID=95742 RepID=A0A9Q9DWE8_CURCL|nr:Ctr copper transporter [Curvularia clavata]
MDMSMPTSSSTSSSSTSMTMSTMSMTFFTSTTTPLFSLSWTPHTAGQYTGTCIFLIALAAIFRALIAVRFNIFDILAYVKGYPEDMGFEGGEKDKGERERRWRAAEAFWVAGLDVGIAGVSYLL